MHTTLLTLLSPLLLSLSLTTATPCPPHPYTTHILSTSPLLIYIRSFLSSSELAHLQHLSATSLFSASSISNASSGGASQHSSLRTSRSVSLPPSSADAILSCIEARALAFQGLVNEKRLEPLQLVAYEHGEKYHAHTDWFVAEGQRTERMGGNRLSSFFVYVDGSEDLVGGGTGFPFVEAPGGREGEEGESEGGQWWCEFVSCDVEWEEGVVVRPIAGNAVFWRNMKEVRGRDGKLEYVGDQKTLHAGLPVQRGKKLGMNIWTREGEFGDEFRRKEDV